MINDIKFGEHTIKQLKEVENIVDFMQIVNCFSKKYAYVFNKNTFKFIKL